MPVRLDRLDRLDRALFRAVSAHRPAGVVLAARGTSALAEPRVVYPGLLMVGVLDARGRTGGCALVRSIGPVVAVAAGAELRRLVAGVVARPRPPRTGWLVAPDGWSLPSRHTTLAVLAVGAAARSLGASPGTALGLPAAAAVSVGASRVLLGVHWPGDVVAGWAFGEAWLRVLDIVTRRLVTEPDGPC